MGWDSTHAKHYYRNGQVNRKAELDDTYSGYGYEVLKSRMVGSVYYAAVKHPEGHVFGLVCLTSTCSDCFNFAYKAMDESMGPYYYDCPKSILKLLSPTDNENSLAWREKCASRVPLSSLPVGTTIRFKSPYTTRSGVQEGDLVTLTKQVACRVFNARTGRTRTSTMWSTGYYRWTSRMIPNDFEIVN